MPVANAERLVSMDFAVSVVSCLRITHFNPGSRVPTVSLRSEATGRDIERLDSPAIAGIAIGAILATVLAGTVFRFRQLRRSKASKTAIVQRSDEANQMIPLVFVEAGADGALQELFAGRSPTPELFDTIADGPVELMGYSLHD